MVKSKLYGDIWSRTRCVRDGERITITVMNNATKRRGRDPQMIYGVSFTYRELPQTTFDRCLFLAPAFQAWSTRSVETDLGFYEFDWFAVDAYSNVIKALNEVCPEGTGGRWYFTNPLVAHPLKAYNPYTS